jgi:hypothetical protein
MNNARLTDIWVGICCCHSHPDCIDMSGPIITCSPNNGSGTLGQARLTDITVGSCGHTGQIITSSSLAFCNTLGKARIGDLVDGCNIGIVVTGNPIHDVGG